MCIKQLTSTSDGSCEISLVVRYNVQLYRGRRRRGNNCVCVISFLINLGGVHTPGVNWFFFRNYNIT